MTFTIRIKAAAKAASFSVSDAAVWFDATRAAMHTWLNEGRQPFENKMPQLEKRLKLLEDILASGLNIFPMPLGTKQYERKEYIEKVKNAAGGLLQNSAASRGHEVLGSAKGER